MPITSVTSDPKALTLTVVGEYPVSVERLWDAWADPRQLEKFWGPPTWPATFIRHDMVVGGGSQYFMTGPDGERTSNCYWKFLRIDAPHRLEVRNGFALEDGSPDPGMPGMTIEFRFESTGTGARFTGVTRFESLEGMEQLVGMGMVEGMTSALGQLDDLLAGTASLEASRATKA